MTSSTGLTYASAGVEQAGRPLAGLLSWVNRTLEFRRGVGEPVLGIGFYANVIRLTETLGLAISTDGVGTKILVAEMLGKYDTLGIDCVAMNANDIICVGAEPLAMVDYLAVQRADPAVLEALGRGLYEGARQANINIPGGELAQLGDMIQGARPGEGVDLMGTCVGLVDLDRIIVGRDMLPGDVVIGLASSGIHSNGLTLARKALFDAGGFAPTAHVAEFGRSAGEELLEPTRIYVRPVWQMIRELPGVTGLYHITGDGLLNLTRGDAPLGFELSWLPEPQAVFQVIRRCAGVAAGEMYRTFNMGVGFCVVARPEAAAGVRRIAGEHGIESWELGVVVADERKRVHLRPVGLVGEGDEFHPAP